MNGARLRYTVTWLEMSERPERPRARPPLLRGLSLLRAEAPPTHFFRYLYDVVGRDHHWTDLHDAPEEDLAAFLQDEAVRLFVAYSAGWPAGFIMLDFRDPRVCDISYFGLAPEMIGRGLGDWLLGEGVHMAWAEPIDRLTVNTCSLDHPRALPTYQKWGFRPVRREERERDARIGGA